MVDDDDDSRPAKRQEMMIMYSDFISNLPDNVIDQILVRLPIREAVRTSVLSTNWRYKWTTIAQLVFHDDHNLGLPSSPHNNKDKLINFINLVFLLHSGFIHKFELSNTCLPISSCMIDAWILFLSRKNIKEVNSYSSFLLIWVGNHISCLVVSFLLRKSLLWSFTGVYVLKKPPPRFTGFSNLKSLYLYRITFVDEGGFECLISECPVLERLTLISVSGLDNLNISSPNLKFLCLACTFEDICFENTPLLSDVVIQLIGYNFTDQRVEKFSRTEARNVIKVLSSLPSLKKFAVNECFLMFLSLSRIPVKLPFTCYHLNNLTLQLNFEDVSDMCVTLCLLSSSPNLQELDITSYLFSRPGHDIENIWKPTYIDWKMSRLQVVKITNYNGYEFKSGLEFIKLLLANLPMLEMLSIRPHHKIHELQRLESMAPGKKHMLLLQLLRFKRASSKAVIEFPDFV